MKAIEKAVYYLNIKPRSKAQVRSYLADRGYEADEISDAVSQLEEYGYIDDFRFAVMYAELGFEKGRGILRIGRELKEKGVSSEDIERAFESLDDIPDQYDAALKTAEGFGIELNAESYEEKQKVKAGIARRLASRGYPADIAYKVAGELVK